MIHAYSESYLYDAKQNLAECFDYAISNCRFNADIFSKLFVQSGYADKFERGNPAIVSGISGIELAQKIIMYAYTNYKFPKKIFSEERSEVYWAGWALAEYQWATCRRFKDIFSRIPLSEIVTMYSVYHEMDIGHFIEDMNKKYMSVTQEIHLKTIRENRNGWVCGTLIDVASLADAWIKTGEWKRGWNRGASHPSRMRGLK